MTSKTMRITVAEDGTLRIDGAEKNIADLTQPFLEQLVDRSLDGDVKYEIAGSMPLAKFFQKLEEGTREGSTLRELKESLNEEDGSKEALDEDPEVISQFAKNDDADDEDIIFQSIEP